ncbi:DUF2484 family protein [Roseisalinus antarcticus]|uniref:UDP-N-acetylmuramate--alanine ligase n=1 Tax=Roseisalinus antarcticus TaxID=254357 RepID=A0A1Y5SHK9_9RHOB|nr:DUF2484 family protein [Roseisalinus antarcticus]SLN39839.1 hypothetical protein ROA7023_01533 [Roseisalinus antarcticus]
MSASALAGILWVLAATATAFLPMRRQYVPGLTLLALAPVLIGWLTWQHGWWIGGFALFAFLSMFRNPLRYLIRRALGLTVEAPPQ